MRPLNVLRGCERRRKDGGVCAVGREHTPDVILCLQLLLSFVVPCVMVVLVLSWFPQGNVSGNHQLRALITRQEPLPSLERAAGKGPTREADGARSPCLRGRGVTCMHAHTPHFVISAYPLHGSLCCTLILNLLELAHGGGMNTIPYPTL